MVPAHMLGVVDHMWEGAVYVRTEKVLDHTEESGMEEGGCTELAGASSCSHLYAAAVGDIATEAEESSWTEAVENICPLADNQMAAGVHLGMGGANRIYLLLRLRSAAVMDREAGSLVHRNLACRWHCCSSASEVAH